MSKGYEFLDHPADVGFTARGATLEECFAAAAEAFNEFGWESGRAEPREALDVRARAASLEDLMFSWLSELLYLSDGEQWVFRRFEVASVVQGVAQNAARDVTPGAAQGEENQWEIQAVAHGEKFDEARHRARTYVKAVTYHQLAVRETAGGWEATVYIDV